AIPISEFGCHTRGVDLSVALDHRLLGQVEGKRATLIVDSGGSQSAERRLYAPVQQQFSFLEQDLRKLEQSSRRKSVDGASVAEARTFNRTRSGVRSPNLCGRPP